MQKYTPLSRRAAFNGGVQPFWLRSLYCTHEWNTIRLWCPANSKKNSLASKQGTKMKVREGGEKKGKSLFGLLRKERHSRILRELCNTTEKTSADKCVNFLTEQTNQAVTFHVNYDAFYLCSKKTVAWRAYCFLWAPLLRFRSWIRPVICSHQTAKKKQENFLQLPKPIISLAYK